MNAETEPIVPENEGEKFLELARRQILRQRFFRVKSKLKFFFLNLFFKLIKL